ncbi:MAG: C39 family peptidase [Verrucomicrobiota bacterium]
MFLSLVATTWSAPIEAILDPQTLWSHTPDSFPQVAAPLGFRWNSQARDSARSAAPGMTLGGIPVVELLARFSDGKLSGITAAIYTRGDAGEMSRGDFEALVKRTVAVLSELTGTAPQVRGKDPKNAVRADGVIWQTAQTTWLLEYSVLRTATGQGVTYRPDFLRLEVTQAKGSGGSVFAKESSGGKKFEPKSRVKRTDNGDIWIDEVPMVDQGEKGYCVVASAERVLRYYGMRVDQNELAQLAGSDPSKGTMFQAAMEGLKTAGHRLQFRVKPVDEPEFKEFEVLVQEYNRRVAKTDKEAIIAPLVGMIDTSKVMLSMKPDVLRAIRASQKSAFTKFQKSVALCVDSGQPLMWGVLLGLVPEKGTNVQTAGGHARLIIGYNTRTNELLYTDSWGAGHELKRMSMEDAWIINRYSLLLLPL